MPFFSIDAIAHAAGIYGGRRTVTLLDKPAPDRQCARKGDAREVRVK
jgi:hypothetical protein